MDCEFLSGYRWGCIDIVGNKVNEYTYMVLESLSLAPYFSI